MTDSLDRLGKRHRALLDELAGLKPKLHEAMRAHSEELTQREIMEKSGYKTIQQVRVILGKAKPTR